MKKMIIIVIFIIAILTTCGRKDDKGSSVSKSEQTENYTVVYPTTSGTGSWNSVEYPCDYCFGAGYITCSACKGSGKNEVYDYLSPVMKGFEKRYCECCNGTGKLECGRCHGTGKVN